MASTAPPARFRFVPRLEPLETRATPASLYTAVGSAFGQAPVVQVNRPDGSLLARFAAFDLAFTGGVRAAVGELDGDPNTVEVAVGAGYGGGPEVRVFRFSTAGAFLGLLADFNGFDPGFRGGLSLAIGNLDGRPGGELVVGALTGSSNVRTFSSEPRGSSRSAPPS